MLKPAVSASTRMSQARARDAPAPAATPLTAAITGLGMVASASHDRVVVPLDGVNSATVEPLRSSSMCSLRSWPTQNARPVPVSTTQRTGVVGRDLLHDVAQQLLGGDVEAVHGVGPVEGDRGDAVVDAQQDGRVALGQDWSGGWEGSLMARSLPDQVAAGERVRTSGGSGRRTPWRRAEPLALDLEVGGRPDDRPSRGAAARGQAGVGEEELAPLVDEAEARGVGRLLGIVVARPGRPRPGRRHRAIQSA